MANAAAEIRPLELALARAVKAATAAQQALDAARSRLSLRPAPPQFFSASEMARVQASHELNIKGVTQAIIATLRPSPGDPFFYLSLPETAQQRAAAAWVKSWIAADAILKQQKQQPQDGEAAAATAAAITRAAAVARGEITELPRDQTARSIVAAGRKRRAEP